MTKRRRWWIVIGGLVVASVLGIAVVWLPLAEWVEQIRRMVAAAGIWGVPLFVVSVFLWNLVLPVGPLQVVAGMLFGLGGGIAVTYLGVTAAMLTTFILARWCVRARVQVWVAKRPRWAHIDQAIGERGWRIVLLLRLGNLIPSNVVGWVLGASRVRMATALTASWVGKAPGVFASVAVGVAADSALAERQLGVWTWMAIALGIAASLIAVIYLGALARHSAVAARSAEVGGDTQPGS